MVDFLLQFDAEAAKTIGQSQSFASRNHADSEPTGVGGRSSAYSRLRLVLMHDRTQLEPHTIEAMRDDLVGVISKYIQIDRDMMELNLETDPETNTVALVANIPVKPIRGASVGMTTLGAPDSASASETIAETMKETVSIGNGSIND
ncbi:MAG: cell division topological specificity factor MinE [Vampirovibrio sp.]|nr:cell division topological specificity factor MinE [Vampirovibrio sp.]